MSQVFCVAACLLGLLQEPQDKPVGQQERTPVVRAAAEGSGMKTLGGRQLWGDVEYFHKWRIQRHCLTRHYRLLDGNDSRHASGTLTECQSRLAEIRKQQKLPPMSGKSVVLIHGIIRSSKSFTALRRRLEKEGYAVFAFDYPSTRVSVSDAADHLKSCLKSLKGIEEINFVTHSMGGLVLRAALADAEDKRFRRLVMLGVPNRGAQMADKFRGNPLFRLVLGPAGQQLARGEGGVGRNLPTPDFEFGILSGARGTPGGYNPLIPGDDDGTVGLRSTRLPGAIDFHTVPVLHSFLMSNKQCIDATVRFIQHGRFREKGPLRPIKPRDASGGDSPQADHSGSTGEESAGAGG